MAPNLTQIRGHSSCKSLSALGRIRTCNLLIRSQVLYPLSYGRMVVHLQLLPSELGVAEARGFEPPVPVKGQLISSESHSAALARLLTFTADPTAYTGVTGEGKAQVSDP